MSPKDGGYDLIFTGKETIDYNGSSIGGMVAELLDLPFISLATKFDLVWRYGHAGYAKLKAVKKQMKANSRWSSVARKEWPNNASPI